MNTFSNPSMEKEVLLSKPDLDGTTHALSQQQSYTDGENIIICLSVALNLFTVLIWLLNSMKENIIPLQSESLTWTKTAAKIAEEAASHSCSGRGYVFADSSPSNKSRCECFQCYTGDTCSELIHDCEVDVDGGIPLYLEPFWLKNAEASAIVTPGWYRMGYLMTDDKNSAFSRELESLVRSVHDLVGNANTDGKYIVFGVGSMQLVNAAIHSLSQMTFNSTSNKAPLVVSVAPYYNGYESQTKMFNSMNYKWGGDAKSWANNENMDSNNFVEIVTSPNNPTALTQNGVLKGGNVKRIYDRAYYWPHYTPINQCADEDMMLFSVSKFTGHAGTRFGWAIVKDRVVFEKMKAYVAANTIGVSHDSQFRATSLLMSVINGYQSQIASANIFDFGYSVMRSRWERMQDIFNKTDRFSLQNIEPAFCNFFGRETGPSPAYAWIKCERDEDEDCTQVMKKGRVKGRGGENFGGGKKYVRITMLKRNDNFELLMARLEELVLH